MALEILENRYDRPCAEEQRKDLLSVVRKLPAHPDVPEGLETLRKEGFQLTALTNSTASTAEAQPTHADIRHVFSADTAKRLKPERKPYDMVASELKVPPRSLLLVCADCWDIAGAVHASWNGAFLARRAATPATRQERP